MRVLRSLVVISLVAAAGATRADPPAAGPVTVVASGLDGAEGLAFDKAGRLFAGQSDGTVARVDPDGTLQPYASLGERLAGLAVLRDGRLVALAFDTGNVWTVPAGGGIPAILATVPGGVNAIASTRSGRVFVSLSTAGTIVDVSTGTAVVAASGLTFPNGLAIGPDRFLYVAETALNRISRLPLSRDGTLGTAEVYATGTPLADGIAFDRRGNLLVAGFDQITVVDRATRTASVLSTDPLLDWPSNLAFGHGRGFGRRDVFMVNYGLPLGSGTTLVRMPYNHGGAAVVH